MKFSFCSIAFRKNHTSLSEIIPRLSHFGYDGLELWANHLSGGLSQAQEIRKRLDGFGLEIPMISPYFDFTGSQDKWVKSLESAEKFIELAGVLKAPLIRVFTGVVGSKEATEIQWRNCVKGLKIVAQMTAGKGISLALETHPSTLVDNTESTLMLLERVGAQNLRVNLDIYHLWEVHRDPLKVLDALYPHVAHIHAKNAFFSRVIQGRDPHPFLHDRQAAQEFQGIAQLKAGEMDYKPFLEELVKREFPGFISIEWFGDNIFETAERELAYLRQFTPV